MISSCLICAASVTKKLKIELKDNAQKIEKMNKNISYYKDHNS